MDNFVCIFLIIDQFLLDLYNTLNNHRLNLNVIVTLVIIISYQIQMNLISIPILHFFALSRSNTFLMGLNIFLCFHHVSIYIVNLFYIWIAVDVQFLRTLCEWNIYNSFLRMHNLLAINEYILYMHLYIIIYLPFIILTISRSVNRVFLAKRY